MNFGSWLPQYKLMFSEEGIVALITNVISQLDSRCGSANFPLNAMPVQNVRMLITTDPVSLRYEARKKSEMEYWSINLTTHMHTGARI